MHLKPYLLITKSHSFDMEGLHHEQHAGEYGSALARVKERLHKHPSTWVAHGTSKSGLMAIVAMEYQELMEAKASGDEKHIEKELCDLAAACIRAYEHL